MEDIREATRMDIRDTAVRQEMVMGNQAETVDTAAGAVELMAVTKM